MFKDSDVAAVAKSVEGVLSGSGHDPRTPATNHMMVTSQNVNDQHANEKSFARRQHVRRLGSFDFIDTMRCITANP